MANDNIDNAIEKIETICKDNSNLLKKTEYQIPRGIFPNEEDITLCDIKVNSGSDDMGDDAVYKKNVVIQTYIPRGLTILKNITTGFQDICIYANKKFYDDDETVKLSDKIVSMEKMNGEALHFSCRYISNNFYLFIGSKTNHIVINKKTDIDLCSKMRQCGVRYAIEIIS